MTEAADWEAKAIVSWSETETGRARSGECANATCARTRALWRQHHSRRTIYHHKMQLCGSVEFSASTAARRADATKAASAQSHGATSGPRDRLTLFATRRAARSSVACVAVMKYAIRQNSFSSQSLQGSPFKNIARQHRLHAMWLHVNNTGSRGLRPHLAHTQLWRGQERRC